MTETTQTLSITPHSALSRLLSTRPTHPDVNRHLLKTLPYDPEAYEIPMSDTLNRVAERYDWVLSQAFPLLDEGTWRLVLDSENGRSEYALHELDRFADGLMDHLGIEADQTPDDPLEYADSDALGEVYHAIGQLAALTPVQRLFVAEVVERFWGSPGQARSIRKQVASLARRPQGAVFRDDCEDPDTALLERWDFTETALSADGEADEDDVAWTSAHRAEHRDYDGLTAIMLCQRVGDGFRMRATRIQGLERHPRAHYDHSRALKAELVEAFDRQILAPSIQ